MAAVPPSHGLALAGALFLLGLTGVLVRRNVLFVLISIEVMLNAAGLAFISAGSRWVGSGSGADGQIMFLFILTMSAAEVAVALALILEAHRRWRTLDVDSADRMRG